MKINRIFSYFVSSLSVTVSMFLLLAHIFSWTPLWAFIELFTTNSLFNVYTLYGVIVLLSLVSLTINRKSRLLTSLLTVGINIITILLLVFVPFRNMGLQADIQNNFEERLRVVQLIEDEELHIDNRGMARLPFYLRYLSKEGGIVLVEQDADVIQVFFFTFKGVLDNFSGILYSSVDAEPQNGVFGADVQELERLKDNWYWVASW